MVDIHSHLLPDYDDGPPTIDHTREMLQVAEQGGTRIIVATPHILDITDYDREDEILYKFKLLRELVKKDGRNIKVFLAGEIFLFPDTKLDRIFSTFNNNKKYALVEFSMRQIPDFVPQKLFDFVMDGFHPVLAHPERYIPIIRSPKYAYKFVQMDVALQMNAGSILGAFGDSVKRTARQLLDHRCIHIIASDGHNTNSRSIDLGEVRKYIVNTYGEEQAKILLEENPLRVIRGEPLIKEEPIPFEDKTDDRSIWRKLKKKTGLDKFI